MKTSRIGGLFLLLTLLTACAARHTDSPDTSFAEYVSAYTGGIVPEGTAIRIELVNPVPMERQTDNLFSFKPSLQGSQRWLSPTVVEFVPDALKEGTVYEGSFQVGKVVDVPDAACQVFPFRIQAAPKTATLTLDGITLQDGARLEGTIRLSVPATREDIGLTVEPAVPVTVSGEGNVYRFETGSIDRSEKDKPVKVTLKVNGFHEVEPLQVVIPATGSFKVIDTRIVRNGNPCVEVRFSEPLAASAAREGLLELTGTLRQTVDIQDNCARIFFEADPQKDVSLIVHRGVKSADGQALAEEFRTDFPAPDPFPAVEIPLEGNILPDESNLILPFRAVNLSAVDLRIIKIYENNVLLFLQENDLGGATELRRAGRLVYSRQIPLMGDLSRNPHEWNDYSIDLSGLFRQEPGAIYRIRLSFRQEYSLYGGRRPSGMSRKVTGVRTSTTGMPMSGRTGTIRTNPPSTWTPTGSRR